MSTEENRKEICEFLAKLHSYYIESFLRRENIDAIVSESFSKATKEKAFENHFIELVGSATEDIDGFRIIQQPSYPVEARKKIGDVALTFQDETIAFYEIKVLYTLHNIKQSRTKRIQGVIKDIRSLIQVKESLPKCSCFLIVVDVGDRYLFKNLENEVEHIRPPVVLKGEWHKPSIKVAFGVFEIEANS